jgi:hypothetical protein
MEEISAFLKGRGAALVGVADLAPVPEPMRRGFPRAVSFGVSLDPVIIAAYQQWIRGFE